MELPQDDTGPNPHGEPRASVRFSVISAVFNVSKYLQDFIESIEAQTYPLERVEVVVVDDGSTDDSLAVLEDWAARAGSLVTVISKENGGQGSARNLGIDVARGEWLTFLDPDDMIDPQYLATVDRFIEKHPAMSMVATNRIYLEERTGEIIDSHPLRRMFRRGDNLVDLTRFPEYFHGSAPSAFMRADVLRSSGIRFDVRVRPNFEDGHFCVRYLLAAEGPPLVGFLKSARYIYRRRADGTSTLQNSLRNPDRFVSVPRYGYLDALTSGTQGNKYPPEWVQQFVLYELSWYFSADVAMTGAATAAKGDVARIFVETLREIAQLLDPQVVESFSIRRFDRVWRDILLHLNDEDWHTPFAVLSRYDAAKKLVQVSYRYRGTPPAETILYRGRPVVPAYAKARVYEFFDQVLMEERIAWVPANGTVRVMLDGVHTEIRRSWPGVATTSVRPSIIESWFGLAKHPDDEATRRETVTAWLIRRLANLRPVRKAFRDAWVLMDRIDDADDNAERLFRYLRKNRRGVNAWFVIEKDTPDWRRLKKDGYRRVVPHGSLVWKLLLLNCRHLVSSHADITVQRPRAIAALGPTQWKFTFLQHGVIKDDLSRWLNGKQIDLFVTSTPAEYESIVADRSPYVYTAKEVKRTGLPRFDRLREMGEKYPPGKRDLLLVCPTWRTWLSAREAESHVRAVTQNFLDSEYSQQWLGLLRNEELAALAKDSGLKIAFLPHPNIQPVLSSFDLPDWVEPLTYAGRDVQEMIARSAVMITDYSSMAFNAAYLDRPVVYFQFDAQQVFTGGHLGVRGYYDYDKDGFGPVAAAASEVVTALHEIAAASDDFVSPADYQHRIDAAFPDRDGRCCERVANAIEDLTSSKR